MQTGLGVSVGITSDVSVGWGGRVSVWGNARIGALVAEGIREQPVNRAVRMRNERMVGERFKVLFVPEFAFDYILFINGDLVVVAIAKLAINHVFDGLAMFFYDLWRTQLDEQIGANT